MRSELVSVLLLFITTQSTYADSRELRPCFERYANHRLVNVRPYHSEWRMTTEDSCLLFCAQSASRCRSIVYDTVQHICHYFSDEGVDQAVLSAKMTYLRVVSKECLQENANLAASPPAAPPVLLTTSSDFNSNQVHQELSIPQPPVVEIESIIPSTESPVSMFEETATSETITFEPATEPQTTTVPITENVQLKPASENINEEDLDKELKELMEPSQFQGSFNDEEENVASNGVYRDKAGHGDRWIDSMEKNVEKKTINEKLDDLKNEDPEKYEMLMGDDKKEGDEEVEEEKENMKKNMRYGAKVIKFDEDAAFRKQSELRRKPTLTATSKRPQLKQVTISSTSYLQKAKSFLNELNGSEEEGEVEPTNGEIIKTECQDEDVEVWVAFENSEQDDGSDNTSNDANVPNRKDCQKLCEQKNCRSFTYFEKTNTCHLISNSDGVTLKVPADGDFTASSSTKFCYPSTFSAFEGCSNFVAFRDYTVKIPAVEEFDGLPLGYEGMQLCLELCVLSTRYTCRSATFNPIIGKCRLLTEDSLSSPDDFKYNEFQKDLYFENGCTSTGNESSEVSNRNVEVVAVKPKKLKKRIRRVKKIRRRRH